MNEKELFNKAYNLIKDKKKWCQKWFAKNSAGEDCRGFDVDAVCWCSTGALEKYAPAGYNDPVFFNIMEAFKKQLSPGLTLAALNDRKNYDVVMGLWYSVGKAEGWL